MSPPSLELIQVERTDEHVMALWNLLKARVHNISHRSTVTFEEHEAFVQSHPYRAWYLIKRGELFVGSIYLLDSNNIGVSTLPGHEPCIQDAIRQVMATYAPLPAIKSVRAAVFSINVAPSNASLISAIEQLGGVLTQHTFVLKPSGA